MFYLRLNWNEFLFQWFRIYAKLTFNRCYHEIALVFMFRIYDSWELCQCDYTSDRFECQMINAVFLCVLLIVLRLVPFNSILLSNLIFNGINAITPKCCAFRSSKHGTDSFTTHSHHFQFTIAISNKISQFIRYTCLWHLHDEKHGKMKTKKYKHRPIQFSI